MEITFHLKQEECQETLKQMELLKKESHEKEDNHLKLFAEYKASVDRALNFTQAFETEDSQLLHIKITQLE